MSPEILEGNKFGQKPFQIGKVQEFIEKQNKLATNDGKGTQYLLSVVERKPCVMFCGNLTESTRKEFKQLVELGIKMVIGHKDVYSALTTK